VLALGEDLSHIGEEEERAVVIRVAARDGLNFLARDHAEFGGGAAIDDEAEGLKPFPARDKVKLAAAVVIGNLH